MATFQAIGSVAEAVARLLGQAWQPSLLNGIDALETLRQQGIDVPVVFLTMHNQSGYARRALRAGAHRHDESAHPPAGRDSR